MSANYNVGTIPSTVNNTARSQYTTTVSAAVSARNQYDTTSATANDGIGPLYSNMLGQNIANQQQQMSQMIAMHQRQFSNVGGQAHTMMIKNLTAPQGNALNHTKKVKRVIKVA